MTERTLIVVQARAGSTRLPGKVLADLGGMPMLELQLRRLLPITETVPCTVVVATSDLPGDDPVAAVADAIGLPVVRGSEADVLSRYRLALARHPARTVVRLTGDCPLTDPAIVAAALDLHQRAGADYTSNVLPRSFPKGLDVEVLSATALEAADADATEPGDREHVTPFVYRRPERFRLANLQSGQPLGEEWWTVDTAADLEQLRAIVAQIPEPLSAGWTQILELVGRQVRPAPGVPSLAPLESAAPGTSPWVRRWSVDVDGSRQGTITVLAGEGGTARSFEGADRWREPALAALDRLLEGDQQTR